MADGEGLGTILDDDTPLSLGSAIVGTSLEYGKTSTGRDSMNSTYSDPKYNPQQSPAVEWFVDSAITELGQVYDTRKRENQSGFYGLSTVDHTLLDDGLLDLLIALHKNKFE